MTKQGTWIMALEARTLEDYMELPYRTFVAEDRCGDKPCFMAYNPELEGCMAQGDTIEEALANLQVARKEYIETALNLGWDVPLPAVTVPAPQRRVVDGLLRSVGVQENVNANNIHALAG